MWSLHPETLQLVSVIVTLVSAGVSLLTWYRHRGGPGLRGWAIALLLGGASAILEAVRGPEGPFRLIVLGDAMLVAGFATMWMSMRRFNDHELAPELMAVIIGTITSLFVVLFTLAWQAGPAARAQAVVLSLFIVALAFLAAWETWRGRRLDGLRSRAVAAIALAGIGLARLARAATTTLAGVDLIDADVRAVVQGYATYATTVCVLIVTFGLVLMASERFERQYGRTTDGRQRASGEHHPADP